MLTELTIHDTRDRLLDLAEDMFAKSGIDKVSLRAVTAAAGVNVSAIHYHFGSKDELLRAIFVRRVSKTLAEKERRLATFSATGDTEADVRQIMTDYIEPATQIDCAENNYRFSRLIGQLSMHDESLPADMFHVIQRDVDDAYLKVLATVLPDLTASDLTWRLEFVTPIVGHGSRVRARLERDTRRRASSANADEYLQQLITAAVAIFCAPSASGPRAHRLPGPGRKGKKK